MDFAKAKVLVVEDMSAMRDLVTACLRDIGVKTIYAVGDGRKALPHLKDVDLIVCDWDMPDMNGLMLLKEVRVRPELEGLPFLMLTAVSAKEQVAEAIKAGVTDYMTKPFQPKQLTDRVSRIIKGIGMTPKTSPGFEDLTDM